MTEQLPAAHFADPRAGAGPRPLNRGAVHRHRRVDVTPPGRVPTRLPFAGLPAVRWESRYRWAVIASDVFATVLAVSLVGGFVVRAPSHRSWSLPVDLAVITILVVCGALPLNRSWHPSVLGQGAEEFRRLGRGLATAVVILALGGLAGGLHDIRGWVFVVVPAVAVLAMAQGTSYVVSCTGRGGRDVACCRCSRPAVRTPCRT